MKTMVMIVMILMMIIGQGLDNDDDVVVHICQKHEGGILIFLGELLHGLSIMGPIAVMLMIIIMVRLEKKSMTMKNYKRLFAWKQNYDNSVFTL